MKGIKEYIQFGINSGLNIKDTALGDMIEITHFDINDEGLILLKGVTGAIFKYYYIGLLTSRPFIESITRGILKEKKESIRRIESTRDEITTKQAFAIREDELEEYINNILPN